MKDKSRTICHHGFLFPSQQPSTVLLSDRRFTSSWQRRRHLGDNIYDLICRWHLGDQSSTSKSESLLKSRSSFDCSSSVFNGLDNNPVCNEHERPKHPIRNSCCLRWPDLWTGCNHSHSHQSILTSKLNICRGACYKLKPGLPKCSKPSRCSTRPPLHLPPLQCLFSVSFCQLSFSDQSIIFSVFKVSQSLSTFMSTRILWRAVPAQPKPTTGENYFQNKNYFQK